MAGIGLREVQDLLGHKSIQMTCRCAHLAPSHQLAAVERLVAFPAEDNTDDPTRTRNGASDK